MDISKLNMQRAITVYHRFQLIGYRRVDLEPIVTARLGGECGLSENDREEVLTALVFLAKR